VDYTEAYHRFLKADLWTEWEGFESDQRKQVPFPDLEKPAPQGARLIDLVPPEALTVGRMPLFEVIGRRRSRRKFTQAPLTLEELSFLLWATQGVQHILGNGAASLRTVPSGGARHPFETYLAVFRVEGLEPGLYRYLALKHKLCFLRYEEGLAEKVSEGCAGQSFAGASAVTFIWACIPYRTEWRYAMVAAKIIAQDSGHLCQNLYLASEAIGAGTCAIGAYDQAKMDALLGLDGRKEFTIYVAPVGKIG
jgi:SagB-type dehydrogenase family enzyme